MTIDRLKVGVIGVGHLGQHHARVYADLPGVTLVGVADLDEPRCRSIGERYHVPFYTDYSALLEQAEAVSVAVPTSVHYPVVKACLEAGRHVLVEKPVTATPWEGEQLVRIASERKLTFQVGHIERFNPILDRIRPVISRPGFIECHRLSTFQPRGIDVDVVLDLMIHDLDMILSLPLGEIHAVEAVGGAVLTDNIDIANARLACSSGCVVNLTASRVSTGKLRKLRVFQPDAYLTVDYQAREAMLFERIHQAEGGPTVRSKHIRGENEEPLRRELTAFVSAVQHGTPPVVSGEQGVAALALANRVLKRIQASNAGEASGGVPFRK